MVPPAAGPGLESLERLRSGLQIMATRALGDPEAAEEAVQETLVRAATALAEGRIREPEKLGAYARGIARNVIADFLRRRKRTFPLSQATQPEHSTRSTNPLHTLITKEEGDRLRRVLSHLSPRDQEILRLSFVDGLTPGEIAAQVGEPPSRIRKRKSRALSRLRLAFFKEESACHE